MKIVATFINRKYDSDAIELVHAWDEFCIEDNEEGYEDDLKRTLAAYGNDVLHAVTVHIDVDYRAIHTALTRPLEIKGAVSA